MRCISTTWRINREHPASTLRFGYLSYVNINHTYRCNPMKGISTSAEAVNFAITILTALNKNFVEKQRRILYGKCEIIYRDRNICTGSIVRGTLPVIAPYAHYAVSGAVCPVPGAEADLRAVSRYEDPVFAFQRGIRYKYLTAASGAVGLGPNRVGVNVRRIIGLCYD